MNDIYTFAVYVIKKCFVQDWLRSLKTASKQANVSECTAQLILLPHESQLVSWMALRPVGKKDTRS